MPRKRPGRKVRVDFRQNRQVRRRADDWTQRYRADSERLEDTELGESVRAKGALSRKRTVIVDEHNMTVVDEAQWLAGTVIKVHGLIAYVRDDQDRAWECTVRRVLRTLLINSRSPVTVGDRVWFSDQAAACDGEPVGVIERVAERKSRLSRRDRRKREHTIVANADQLLAVVSVAQPRLRPHLVDRYIVAALKGGLEPIICFNKVDLLDDNELTEEDSGRTGISVREVLVEFQDLGYRCLLTSPLHGVGMDELRETLARRVTVVAGQSGVGKSTLLNKIQPTLNLTTQTVSEENEKGRHTTTLAEMHRLDIGGYVVDTPGIRAFDLWSVEPGELEALFVEFAPLVEKCRFSNCSHRNEAGCAIAAAVENGVISARRYFSYLKMLEEV